MDKLIKLLNEYKIYTDHKKSRMSEYIWINVWDDIVMDSYVWTTKDKTLEIISKKFWFIKRLVDNHKIDFSWEWELSLDLVNLFERKVDNADWVIALLSISDTPIEDLVSYLK